MANDVAVLKGVVLSYPSLLERKAFKDGPAVYQTAMYIAKNSAAGQLVGKIFATYPNSYRGDVNERTSPIKDGDKKFLRDGNIVEDVLGKGMWVMNPSARVPGGKASGAKFSNDIPLYVRDSATGKPIKLDRDKDKEQLQNLCYGGANADVKVSFYVAKGSPGAELLGVCFNGFGDAIAAVAPVAEADDFAQAAAPAQITQLSSSALQQLSEQQAEKAPSSPGLQELGDDEVPF